MQQRPEADTISRRAMMKFIHAAVVVLSLLSVGQSAAVTSCESLIQPFEITGREQLLGKWIQVAESTDNIQDEIIKKNFQDNYWIKITAANESDAVILMGTAKTFGFCITTTVKTTLENSTLQPTITNMTLKASAQREPIPSIKLLKTGCSDCLLLESHNHHMFGRTLKVLQLLSKRRTVTAAEMEEFKMQAECLHLRQPYSWNAERGICSEPPHQETEITDGPRVFPDDQTSAIQNITEVLKSGRDNAVKMILNLLVKKD